MQPATSQPVPQGIDQAVQGQQSPPKTKLIPHTFTINATINGVRTAFEVTITADKDTIGKLQSEGKIKSEAEQIFRNFIVSAWSKNKDTTKLELRPEPEKITGTRYLEGDQEEEMNLEKEHLENEAAKVSEIFYGKMQDLHPPEKQAGDLQPSNTPEQAGQVRPHHLTATITRRGVDVPQQLTRSLSQSEGISIGQRTPIASSKKRDPRPRTPPSRGHSPIRASGQKRDPKPKRKTSE